MPRNHPRLRYNGICTIPGCYVKDPTGTSITNHDPGCTPTGPKKCSHYGQIQTPGFLNSVVRLAQYYRSDLCYWAFQTLPPPRNSQYNFSDTDAQSLLRLGSLANERYHELMGNGVIEGGTSTAGTLVNRKMCKTGFLKGDSCNPRVLNGSMPVPSAIQMIRISQHNNTDAIISNITAWRNGPDLHLPNLNWAGGSGWGEAGGAIFKVLKCDDIPETFR